MPANILLNTHALGYRHVHGRQCASVQSSPKVGMHSEETREHYDGNDPPSWYIVISYTHTYTHTDLRSQICLRLMYN